MLVASTISTAPIASVAVVASDICDTDGLPPEDGHQVPWASCSDTEWGEVPDVHHMVSTVIVSPNGQHLVLPFLPFTVTVRVAHLSTGFTDDPNNSYDAEPEELDATGQIEGHVSLSIQREGNGNEPPDARQVVFFHTFTQRADSTGALRVTAPGLPLGHYRMCTMAQTAAWEPVLSPVLAHGAPNDCVHFATTILPANLSAPHPTSASGEVAKITAAAPAADDPTVCDSSPLHPATGRQDPDGECVRTVLGEIPSRDKMVSTVIRFPKNNEDIEPNQPFTIKTKTTNLATGFSSNPTNEYYKYPQTLTSDGFIKGHSSVTIQRMPDEDEPLDPEIFAFFKGMNDPADGNGELTAAVEKGLPAGDYRLCTMVSSFASQPTLMPVAQRGAQDDCTRFDVY